MSLFDAIGSIVGAGIGAGASILGSQTAADAAKKAGKLQYNQYLQSRQDYAPWMQAGTAALSDLKAALLNGDISKFYTSPGYNYRVGEGVKAIDRSASARGAIDSGATMKALSDYGQNQASSEYGDYLSRLGTLAGYGQQALGATSQLGANAAQGYGQGIGNAGYLRGTGYADAASSVNSGINDYYSMSMLRKMMGGGGY